jgi:hypothetical protein
MRARRRPYGRQVGDRPSQDCTDDTTTRSVDGRTETARSSSATSRTSI